MTPRLYVLPPWAGVLVAGLILAAAVHVVRLERRDAELTRRAEFCGVAYEMSERRAVVCDAQLVSCLGSVRAIADELERVEF
jgi:hypothetical protein